MPVLFVDFAVLAKVYCIWINSILYLDKQYTIFGQTVYYILDKQYTIFG